MRALLLAVLLSSSAALAAPFAVQLGETRLGLDTPAGFTDTVATGSPRLQELAEAVTPASNRVLLFAVSDADMRRFQLGDQLELRRYMIAVTPRAPERERVSDATFKQLMGDALQGLGPPPATKDYQDYLDSRPTGATSLLAELRKDQDLVSVLQGSRNKGGFFQRSTYLLSSTTLLLVRGKALTLGVYTIYDEPADLEWIRTTTTRWIDDLKRLNSR